MSKKARAEDPEVRVLANKAGAGGGGARVVDASLAAIDGLVDVDSVVCGVASDVRPLGGALGMIDWRLCGRLSRLLEQGVVSGVDGEKVLLPSLGRIAAPRIFLYGWGPAAGLSQKASERVAAMVEMVEKAGAQRVAFVLPEPAKGLIDVVGLQIEKLLGDKLVALFAPDPLPPQ